MAMQRPTASATDVAAQRASIGAEAAAIRSKDRSAFVHPCYPTAECISPWPSGHKPGRLGRMPLYPDAEAKVKANLHAVARGERASLVAIGIFTERQFNDINAVRRGLSLAELGSPEIVYIGRHHYASRAAQGYAVEDMWQQVRSALADTAVIIANPRMTAMDSAVERDDGYGNKIRDRAIFECTQRKPRAELFSVIPRGDAISPRNAKGPPAGEPSGSDPG